MKSLRSFSFLLIGTFLFVSCSTTDIYLVRHAEKVDDSRDPALTAAGHQRANDLRDALIGKGISDIYCSDFLRTRQTGQPLATALNKNMILYSMDTVLQLAPILRSLQEKRVLVVGHSNTTPALIKALTGVEIKIEHADYDNLFLVQVIRHPFGIQTTFHRSTFGVPTEGRHEDSPMQMK
ncbi:MAG: histidine phosphatase family protein [Saprospiraceae bacterium]|nr:histidine phosphatase family protein [Saprospiraceae bacterium]